MKKVFLKGKNKEQNCRAGFYREIVMETVPDEAEIVLTAQTFYRLYINGEFVFHGPARAPHGCERLDRIDLLPYLKEGVNHIAAEVASYNRECYYVYAAPGYFSAVISLDGKEIETDDSWKGVLLTQSVQCTERYSHARCDNEAYRLDEEYFSWRVGKIKKTFPVEMVEEEKIQLERVALTPDFGIVAEADFMGVYSRKKVPDKEVPNVHYETKEYLGEIENKKAVRVAYELAKEESTAFNGRLEITSGYVLDKLKDPAGLEFDFQKVYSAFLGVEIECDGETVVDLIHGDRLKKDGHINARAGSCNNAIRLHLQKGVYTFESFEPYSIRYMEVVVRGTEKVKIKRVYLRKYQYPDTQEGSFSCSSEELNRIYKSAKNTYLTNTLDVFMDCPGRERGGWLCDSFWTARSERIFSGNSLVNRAMLENNLYAPYNPEKGSMFPQVYPAATEEFTGMIPNWGMFLVLQLKEYYDMTGDRELVDAYENRMREYVRGMSRYINGFGLLENVHGFVFMDWSLSNHDDYKKPISVPTNALYARVLEILGELYGEREWTEKAENIIGILKEKAKKGNYFADCLGVNKNGELCAKEYTSEAAQYYCRWLGLSDNTDEGWKILLNQHGPCPEQYPENLFLARSNVFIGLYLRMELLSQIGYTEALLKEMKHLFGYMIENGPGTLWENLTDSASVNHGFASHAAVWLVRDVLGIHIPDKRKKTLKIAPHICSLHWAKGSMGEISASWSNNDGEFRFSANVPGEYEVEFDIPEELWDKAITSNGKLCPGHRIIFKESLDFTAK